AVIEVKSNIADHWKDVEAMASRVRSLVRVPDDYHIGETFEHIPVFAVGYTGWKTPEPMRDRVSSGLVDGILVIEHGLFEAHRGPHRTVNEAALHYRIAAGRGPWSLWAFLCCLNQILHGLKDDCADFVRYAPSDCIEVGDKSYGEARNE